MGLQTPRDIAHSHYGENQDCTQNPEIEPHGHMYNHHLCNSQSTTTQTPNAGLRMRTDNILHMLPELTVLRVGVCGCLCWLRSTFWRSIRLRHRHGGPHYVPPRMCEHRTLRCQTVDLLPPPCWSVLIVRVSNCVASAMLGTMEANA